MHATCPAQLSLLDLITRMAVGKAYKSFRSSLCNFLDFPVTSSLLAAKFQYLITSIIGVGANILLMARTFPLCLKNAWEADVDQQVVGSARGLPRGSKYPYALRV